MKVLVDTSVWSLALRRKSPHINKVVTELRKLIQDFKVEIIGAIRQEILSGIRDNNQFNELKQYFSAFPDLPAESDDYEMAAEFFNQCREKGVQGSNTDFLICAMSVRHQLSIFTRDNNFSLYEKHLPVKLHKPG